MLTQKQKLRYTSVSALFAQLGTLICGFILPRLFLEYYGSAVNGLISSITQFLWIVSLAECGVGAVVQSALYKPLAEKNNFEISRIVVAAEHFFRTLAKVLIVYVVILVAVYPNVINANFDFFYTASLIFIIAISSFAQYYFGLTYRLLLNSDQFGFITQIVCIISLILNLILSVILMYYGAAVHIVKLISSIVFAAQPVALYVIAHRWYPINFSTKYDKNAIPQKWNGFAQHLATVVLFSSGTSILSIFSTLENVSVYSIYALVINGIRNIAMSTTSGIQAFLGNIFAQGNKEIFRSHFESFEWKMHTFVVFVFSVTAALIVPFIGVYTKGVSDANYINPIFGITLTAAWGIYCIRYPYNVVILAVGHYKQTQRSAIIEAILNVTIAIALVFKYDIIGVAAGTLFAMIYRTLYFAWYVSKNVIDRSLLLFAKHIVVDVLTILLFIGIINLLGEGIFVYTEATAPSSYWEWLLMAIKYTCIGVISVLIVNMLFFKNRFLEILQSRKIKYFS